MSLAFLEYEEQVGRLWHRLVGNRATLPRFPEAAIRLDGERRRLGVLFRGLGGDAGLELVAGTAAASTHRLRLMRRLGMAGERLDTAERTAELVLLPDVLDCLPTPALNRDLYVWLVAFLAGAVRSDAERDPLRADLAALRQVAARTSAVLAAFPGLRPVHANLTGALLALRPRRRLPPVESDVEAAVRRLHGDGAASGPLVDFVLDPLADLTNLVAPRGYRPFLPSPLWGRVRADAATPPAAAEADDAATSDRIAEDDEERHRRARRRGGEEDPRRDPLTLVNKGEQLLLADEAAGISRPEDDEDLDAARRAVGDMDELALGRSDRPAACRLRLHLDLAAPVALAGASVVAPLTYPEWNWRRGCHLPNHCAVQPSIAPETGSDWAPDDRLRRHIAQVKRRFEALRPRRVVRRAQPDGGELDLDALVRARTDFAAGMVGSERIHLDARSQARDLATAILVDTSFSTDSWVDGRRVLDVEKAALSALAFGLEACGDAFAIFTFSSRRRDAVSVATVKDFGERLTEPVRRRIAALQPGAYTRIGAALRHVGSLFDRRPERHRLLLLLSDGKPNDLDHYEGRYAVEDTRKAVHELRGRGLAVFAVTVDRRAEGYVPRIFGRGGYAMVGHIGQLPDALPAIYRQLVA
ncbi:MAG: VWA domain-containing protein [Reyranellaceae bacterium]